jgi:hypothetical protein
MNILFVFSLGSEVRQFFHSGIISTLIDKGNSVYISSKIKELVQNEILVYDSRPIFIDYFPVQPKRSFLSYYQFIFDQIYDLDKNKWEYGNTKDKKQSGLLNLVVYLMSKAFSSSLLSFIEKKIYTVYNNSDWENLLLKYSIDRIVVNVPNVSLLPLVASQKLGISRYLLYHTNKDVVAQGRFKVPFTKIGVWNEFMKYELLKKYDDINKENVSIIGCGHFCSFFSQSSLIKKSEFLQKNNIFDPNSIIILYSAAAPWVIENEKRYIRIISEILIELNIVNYKLLVRVNPMDSTKEWDSVSSDKILIKYPKWYWNKTQNFNFTYKEDIEEYDSLLNFANCCIGIPSSVTTEAAIKGLPTINICFEDKEVKVLNDLKIKDFWNTTFYNSVRKYELATPVFSSFELKQVLANLLVSKIYFLNENNIKKFLIEQLGSSYTEILNSNVNLFE